MSISPTTRPLYWLRLIFYFSLLFSLLQSVYGAYRLDPTYDEHWHREWNQRFLEKGITERESVTHYKSPTPILLPNLVIFKGLKHVLQFDSSLDLFVQRLPNTLWLLVLIMTSFALAQLIAGIEAGYLAAIAVSLDPNLNAHSSLLTVDVAFACASTLTLYCLLLLARKPDWIRAASFGAAFGLALAIKFTALLFLLSFLLLPLASTHRPRLYFSTVCRWSVLLIAAGGTASLVVCYCYCFAEVARPLHSIEFYYAPFQILAALFPNLRLPLPSALLTGIDHCISAERSPSWNVVILDRTCQNGVWYYFSALWALKTPLLLLLFQLWGGLELLRRRAIYRNPDTRFLFLNLAFFWYYFSCIFQTQVGYRYVLFCLPLAYVLAAQGIALVPSSIGKRISGRLAFAFTAALLSAIELAFYTGNLLAYSNIFVLPKKEAYHFIADSNLDWGQNKKKLNGWIAEAGLFGARVDPVHILPGINIFSTNQLAGVWWNYWQHAWVRKHLEPKMHLGYTYFVFFVDDLVFERFLRETRTLQSNPMTLSTCSGVPGQIPVGEKTEIPPKTTALCLSVKETARIKLEALNGDIDFGPALSPGSCRKEYFSAKQESWYILEPGEYEFCGKAEPGFALSVLSGELYYTAVTNE